MKRHALAPHKSGMCPIDIEVKGQSHGVLVIENGF